MKFIIFLSFFIFVYSQAQSPAHSLRCGEKSEPCPEGLTKLVVTENSEEWKCSGFLISDRIVATNRHCLPEAITSSKTKDCGKNINFFFAATKEKPSETFACAKVLSFSEGPSPSNVANLDYAFLELAQPSARKAVVINHEGVNSTDQLTFWRMDGLVETVMRKDKCTALYSSLLFPFTSDSKFPVATLENCTAEHGHSGSALLNSKGEAVAILEGMNNAKNVQFFEQKFGVKKLKNIIKASNLACIKTPLEKEIALPDSCRLAKAENDFLIEGNQILEKAASTLLAKTSRDSLGIRWAEGVLYDPEFTPLALRKDRLFLASTPQCLLNKETLLEKSKALAKGNPEQKYFYAVDLGQTQLCRVEFKFSPEMEVEKASRTQCKSASSSLLFSLPEKQNANMPFYIVIQDKVGNILASREGQMGACP